MKDKFSKVISSLLVLGIIFIFIAITWAEDLGSLFTFLFFGEEASFSLFCITLTAIMCVCLVAIGCAIVRSKLNQGSSTIKDPRLDHKGIDKTKKFATAEFVSAHKDDEGNYSVRYEYTDQDQEKEEESKPIYSYIEAKYFQKVKRFTICFNETESYIYDTPRPGMIPELANVPIIPNEKAKQGDIEKTKQNQKAKIKEAALVREFCPYCDCAIKPNSKRCPHCSAPIKKSK